MGELEEVVCSGRRYAQVAGERSGVDGATSKEKGGYVQLVPFLLTGWQSRSATYEVLVIDLCQGAASAVPKQPKLSMKRLPPLEIAFITKTRFHDTLRDIQTAG